MTKLKEDTNWNSSNKQCTSCR